MVSLSPVTVQPTERWKPQPETQRLRDEASRIRRGAERMTAEVTRRQLLDIAAQYDKAAERLESQSR